MAPRRTFLIPPSEGKAPGGDGPPYDVASARDPHPLAAARTEVIAALRSRIDGAVGPDPRGDPGLARLFGVKGDALARAVEADSALPGAPTMPAIDRYDGVLYQYLDAASMTAAQKRRLARSVLIFSGLWGVVRPDEAIPDYRLKMSASLAPLGKLSTWWRPDVTGYVAAAARRTELWNLLPREHAAALGTMDEFGFRVHTTAVFLAPNDKGRLTPVNHWNKALKGALLGHLIRHPSTSIEDLLGWEHPAGYRLDPGSIEPVDGVRGLRFISRG